MCKQFCGTDDSHNRGWMNQPILRGKTYPDGFRIISCDALPFATPDPLAAPMNNPNGITVAELKRLVLNLPEADENGDPYEVWFETGENLSSPVTEICRLNHGDILFRRND